MARAPGAFGGPSARPAAAQGILALPRALAGALRRLARRSYPREACGALLGARHPAEHRVEALVPGRNLHPDPRSAFELHPATVVVAARIARSRGLELIGFFHTHPDGAPWPSGADRGAAWDGMLGLIVAVDAHGRTGMAGHLWRGVRAVPLLLGTAGGVDRAPPRD